MAAKKKTKKTPQISVPGSGMLAKAVRKINKRKIANEPKKAAIKRRIAAKIKPKSKKITSTKKTSKRKPS